MFSFQTVSRELRPAQNGNHNEQYDLLNNILEAGPDVTMRVDGVSHGCVRSALKARTARKVHVSRKDEYCIIWYS